MALEDLLREAAAKGLTHLTLYPVDSNDGKTSYWNARATPSTQHSYVQTANHDPVEAVRIVLETLPRAPRRKPRGGEIDKPRFDSVSPPLSEMAQREVTAAVTADGQDAALAQESSEPDEWSRFKT